MSEYLPHIPKVFYWLAGLVFVVSIVATLVREESWAFEHPNHQPFKWGFFQGFFGVFGGTYMVVLGFYLMGHATEKEIIILYYLLAAWGFFAVPSGVLILRKNFWGWLIFSLFTLCPPLWMLNSTYYGDRKSEFRS